MPILTSEEMEKLLREIGVPGVSISIINRDGSIDDIAAGYARLGTKEKMRPNTFLEIASLSKTFASVFAIRYFQEKGITLDYRVNSLLAACGSPFRLRSAPGKPVEWGDRVLLRHLLNHTGLGMHYVNGVPLNDPMPPVLNLIQGKHENDLGYEEIRVHKEPGTKFGYSGGGFLVLQHLLESWEKKAISEIMKPFLEKLGIQDEMTFAHDAVKGVHYATGHRDNADEVKDLRLMFPPLAAGGLGTSRALCRFLKCLGEDFKSGETNARQILRGEDRGSMEFMGTNMGLGVFVADAGPNRFAIHQAANDGFRGVYVVCFDGPDAVHGPNGFVLLNNGDNQGTVLNCVLSRMILQRMKYRGVDFSRVDSRNTNFDRTGMKQEEIVNLGLKQLVFDAFVPKSESSRL